MMSMLHVTPRMAVVLHNPVAFVRQVLRQFQSNQGLLLAGAVAYYALLSIVPLLIIMVMLLSQVIDQAVLFATVERALRYVVPGEAGALMVEFRTFLEHRAQVGWLLVVIMVFFSSLGFKVLENAIFVIFLHRGQMRKRPLAVSLLLPFGYVSFIGAVLFAGAFIIGDLMAMGGASVELFGESFSLSGFSGVLMYLAGVLGEILVISSIYYVMPVGMLSMRGALVGGVSAGLLWEALRLALAWYLGTISQVNIVYGSLTTSIIVLLSLELAATLLLLGAQVIAVYERIPVGEAPPVFAEPAPAGPELHRRKRDHHAAAI